MCIAQDLSSSNPMKCTNISMGYIGRQKYNKNCIADSLLEFEDIELCIDSYCKLES